MSIIASQSERSLWTELEAWGRPAVAAVFGATGGAIGATLGQWFIGPFHAPTDPALRFMAALIWAACIGLCLATSLGAADRLWRGTLRQSLAELPAIAGLGALAGAGSIAVLQFTLALSNVKEIVDLDTLSGRTSDMAIGRALGGGAMGVLIGFAASPVPEWDGRGRAAAIGGGVGGFLGFQALLLASGFDPTHPGSLLLRIQGVAILSLLVALGVGAAPEIGKVGRLSVLTGSQQGLRYPLFRSRCFLGSSPLCHLRIHPDTSVRPRHCLLNWEVDHFVIYDLTGAQETLVNGQGIDREPIVSGDRVRVGNCLLRFETRRRTGQTLPIDRKVDRPTDRLVILRGTCPLCGVEFDPQTGWCACPEPLTTTGSASGFGRPAQGEPLPAALQWDTETLYGTTFGDARFALRVTQGSFAGRVYPVVRDVTALGRYNCDIVIDDPAVSRRHALLLRRGPSLSIRDEGSSNGTQVNGQMVRSADLHSGDMIHIGNTVFMVMEHEGAG